MTIEYICKTLDEVNEFLDYMLVKAKFVSFNISQNEDGDFVAKASLVIGGINNIFKTCLFRDDAYIINEELESIKVIKWTCQKVTKEDDPWYSFEFCLLEPVEKLSAILGTMITSKSDCATVTDYLEFLSAYINEEKKAVINSLHDVFSLWIKGKEYWDLL